MGKAVTVTRQSLRFKCSVKGCPWPKDEEIHVPWCLGISDVEHWADKPTHQHHPKKGMGGNNPKSRIVAILCVTCHDRIDNADWSNDVRDLGMGYGETYFVLDLHGNMLIDRPVLSAAAEAATSGSTSNTAEGVKVTADPTPPRGLEGDIAPESVATHTSAAAPSAGLTHEQRVAIAPTEKEDALYGATSLQLWEGMTYERWTEIGGWLRRMTDSVGWWWGDWVNFGEKAPWGEKYSQALNDSEFSIQTLKNMAWVSNEYETSRRRDVLSWAHHAEAAGLEHDEQERVLDKAEAEHLSKAQVRRLALMSRHAERIRTLPAVSGTFTTIVADPPWPYEDIASRGAAEDHYDVMEIDAICDLEVGGRRVRDLAPAHGAHLYLWTPGIHLREGWALRVVRAWGFEPATMLTWVKPQMGIGNWFRSASEYVLFCTREKLPFTTYEKAYRNWFEADRRKHSQKPDTFYELVQTVSPGPYLDLFGRTQREGWEVWGDEA